MASITCTRRIQFCAGHRVYGHENKCSNVHGHNYVLFATARSELTDSELDSIGRVIDFSVLKEKLGGWIDKFWDHGFIYYKEDKEMEKSLQGVRNSCNAETKKYMMHENPTAENMAWHLIDRICPELFKDTGVYICDIQLWETENCYAEVTR